MRSCIAEARTPMHALWRNNTHPSIICRHRRKTRNGTIFTYFSKWLIFRTNAILYAYCKRCIIFTTNPVSQYRDIKKQKSSSLLVFFFQYFFNTSRRHYQHVSSANIFIGCFDFTCLLVLSRLSIESVRLKLSSLMKFLKTRIKLLGT